MIDLIASLFHTKKRECEQDLRGTGGFVSELSDGWGERPRNKNKKSCRGSRDEGSDKGIRNGEQKD